MMNVVTTTFDRLFKNVPIYMVASLPIFTSIVSALILVYNKNSSYYIPSMAFNFIFSVTTIFYLKNYIKNIEKNAEQLSKGEFQNLQVNGRDDELSRIQNYLYDIAEKNSKICNSLKKYQHNFDETLKQNLISIEKNKNEILKEKNLIEKNLNQLNQLFTIVESTDDAIMICDANRQVQYINPAFIKLTGYQLSEMQESEMDLLRNGRYGTEYYDRRLFDGILKKLKMGRIFRGVLKAKRKNNKLYDAEMTITPIFNQAGKLMAYNIIERDVTLQEKYKEKVYEKLKHDSLTGLLNRESLFDLVQNNLLSEQEITKRIRLRQGLTFIYLDINHFRQFNQELGYEIGDKILIEFSKRIKNTLVEEDVISRVGGNEFVIILTRVNTAEGAEKIKQDLINQLKISIRIDDHILNVKSSIGMALYPGDGLDFESLINKAQDNMQSKRHHEINKKVG